ncbi:putative Cdc25 family phosphatase Ibp1 [Diplocarpon rosae]|nr:putative Cdc25 family phosphatase Ibp1 [Diplocarpon rosae]
MPKMSTHSVANLPRLSSTDLSKILLSTATSNVDVATPPSNIAVVDVRDDDHVGGHIKHSIHAPSNTLDHKIPELVRKLKDKETVVFHCALSQQRGPSAALRYIRERDRLLGLSANLESGSGVGQVLKKNKETEKEENPEWEDVEEKKEQKVYVLDRGFVGWQERYGEDPRLTEGYRKEIWKEGY